MKRIILVSIIIFSSFAFSNTINIPDDYSTIQAGLNAADSSDTVLVQPGTYYENIFWPDKNSLVLIGASRENTIINGSNLGTTIIINPLNNSINESTIIKNLSIISGGNTTNGGGILIVNSSPTLINLSISNNSADKGGGLYLKNSQAKINYCIISNNKTISEGGDVNEGGGIYILGGSPTLLGTIVSGNTSFRGAEISLSDGIIKIDSSTFNNNIAEQNGGAVYLFGNSNCEILNSKIKANKAPNLGGGVCNYGGVCIIDNTVLDNNFSYNGGGIYSQNKTTVKNSFIINHSGSVFGAAILSNHNLEVQNSVIAYNSANAKANPNCEGGGIYVNFHSNIVLQKVAFLGNNSLKSGGCLSVSENSNLTIENCTFSNNSSTKGDAIYVNGLNNNTITNNNFFKNGYGLFNEDNTVYINAINNFWGHFTGPFNQDNNPNGLGDSINYFVNATPWLSSPNVDAPPSPPLSIIIENITNNSITLNWNNIQIGDLAGYKIYYDTDSSSYSYSNSIDIGLDTNYTLSNLTTGTEYFIAVTTYDIDGNESWYSKEVVACPQPAPLIHTSTNEINYGTVVLGDTSERVLTISNQGTAELNVTEISSLNSQFIPTYTSFNLLVGKQKEITIKFIPETYGQITSNLIINSNAYNDSLLIVILSGFGNLSPEPQLFSIEDIPDDQGGEVRLKFRRSKYDGLDSTYKIVSYTVWRLIENIDWDAVGMFNAVHDSFYYFVAPTLGDSTVHGILWSTYKVSAHTENPDIFFYSDSLRGYSIDNIAPGVPEGLLAKESNDNILLTWHPNNEKDFQYYGIYRSTCSNFDPDTMEIYTSATSDTFLYDSDIEGNINYYYRISAFDYSGNESEYSPEVTSLIVGLQSNGKNVPAEYSLSQNYPNPFNPVTNIKYAIPEQSYVTLKIINSAGQVVDVLVNKKQSPGYYTIQWDASGVSSGIYLYKINTKEFSSVKKCLFIK